MNSREHRASDTRSQIIRAAGDLFHKQGFRCTTTDEIIEAVGIPKAEFGQHFKTKMELAGAVLRYHIEELAAGTGPLKYRFDTWSDLEECFASHVDFQKRFRMTRNCPIARLGSELREEDELVRHSLNLAFDLMTSRLECLFSREKMAGRLASNVDVEQLANFCVAVIQGAMLAGKIRVDSRCVESIMEDLLSHLKRYVRVPRAPRKRVAKHHHAKQPTASPKALVPTTIVELQDWSATKDLMEDHHNDPTRPENEV